MYSEEIHDQTEQAAIFYYGTPVRLRPDVDENMNSVDRDLLRERKRQARAATAEQAAGCGAPNTRHHHVESDLVVSGLFRPPVRVNPNAHDRTSHKIQSKLGNYGQVKHLFGEPKRVLGIAGVPAIKGMQNRLHTASVGFPKLPTAEEETIPKETTMLPMPPTLFTQAPRKESESKFTFNPVLAQEILERDLNLSEDSEEDE